MFRLTIFCLCLTLIWASPAKKGVTKIPLNQLTGPRIVNGNSANLGQFPWQAALFADDGSSGWFCGGSIISTNWVLTAGHCVDGGVNGQVRTGSLNPNGGVVTGVSRFVLHENYNGDNLANDIGLVQLAGSLSFNSNTAAISISGSQLNGGVGITVSGWGLTSDSSTSISDTLNYVDLVSITNQECEQYYGTIRSEQVCATSGTSQVKSTCSGDSGGPVVVNGQHVAVVSFVSAEGCESGAPSGYTRSAPYIDWVQSHTR